MKEKLEVHVEAGIDRTARRFVDAWHRAEKGEDFGEAHLSFESWEALTKVLSGKRLQLLRHLHGNPTGSIAELARSLGRDYKRVYVDVDALTQAGLIERNEAGLRAGYDEIHTTIAL